MLRISYITTIILLFSFLSLFPNNDENRTYDDLVGLSLNELLDKGKTLEAKNNQDEALICYLVLIGKYNVNMSDADKYISMKAHSLAGQIYERLGNYSKAFDLYLNAIHISEKNNFIDLLPELYKNIGNIYFSFHDYAPCIDYYLKGLKLAQEQKESDIEIRILNNLIGAYCSLDQIDKAKEYMEVILSYEGNPSVYIGGKNVQPYLTPIGQGIISEKEKDFKEAIKYFMQAIEYAENNDLGSRFIGFTYGKLGSVYEELNQLDTALFYTWKGVEITKEGGPADYYAGNLEYLSRIYQKMGDDKKSLYYKSLYLNIYDSIFVQNEMHIMKGTQSLHELNKNYQTIESLNIAKERKDIQLKAQNKLIVVIAISLLVFLVLLIIVYRQKQKLYDAYQDLVIRNKVSLESERKQLSFPPSSEITEDNSFSDKSRLQSVDKLTQEHKEKLLYDINKVMENPDKFCDCDFSLEKLSSMVESNSRYVSQIINETYNKNFRTFINEYRIKEAQLRLMNVEEYGNYTIKAIAESVGYKSHTSFISLFKKITGVPPSIYQHMIKKHS